MSRRRNGRPKRRQGRLKPLRARQTKRLDLHEPLLLPDSSPDVLDLDALIAALDPASRRLRAVPRISGVIAGLWAWFSSLSLVARIFITAIAVIGLAYVSRLLQRPQLDLGDIPRTYSWNARKNSLGVGLVVPIVYGEHRFFPPIIQQYIDADANDTEILYTLYAISEGRIELIDAIELNEQPIEQYAGASAMMRLGDPTQAAIPWFVDTRNTYGVDVQLNVDARAFIYRTLTAVDRFIVKVKFPAAQGATTMGGASITVTVRVEHRRVGEVTWVSLGDTVITLNTRRDVTRAIASADLALANVRTSGTVANDATIGGTAWTNPTNAQGAGNDVWAEVVELTATPRDTQYLRATNYGFGVPSDATITGIQLEVERHHATGGSSGGPDWDPQQQSTFDRSVRLVVGGAITGTDVADLVTAWPVTDTVRVYGGPGNLLGLASLTSAQANASDFGMVYAARVDLGTCRVDAMTIRLFYTSPTTPAGSRREIRVTRVSSSGSPPMLFHSVDEIIYGSAANTYPNVAVLGTRVQAGDQLSGQPPECSALVRGRRVRIIQQDATLAAEAWTRNPVDCLLDLLTHDRYGLGAYIQDSDVTLSSWLTVKNYCNDFVGGGLRHELDIVLDEQRAAWDWVEFLLNTFRGFLIESDGRYRLSMDHITAPSQLFSDANIERGTLKTSWASLSEEFNQVEFIFYDRDNAFRRDSILQPLTGTKKKTVDGRGVTRRVHATREALYHYNVMTLLSRFVEFDCAIDALAADVSDVIYVQHSTPQWGQGGRVVAVTTSAGNHVITVDRGDLPTAGLTGYVLLIRQTNDTIEQLAVLTIGAPTTSSEGYPQQVITVSGLFLVTPTVRDALWVLGSP